MLPIAKRIIKQIFHDKRSLALILIVPVLLLTLLFLLLGKSSYVPTVAVDKTQINPMILSTFENIDTITIIDMDTSESARQFVIDKKADAVISFSKDGIQITMFEADPVKLSAITDSMKSALASIVPQSQMNIDFIYGSADESTFDSLAFLLLAVLSFFLVFIFAGISFVRERTSNTLERLMRTPVHSISVVSGYSLGFALFAILQSTIMILFTKFVLNITFVGDWWMATIIMLLIAITAVMLGILVSMVSKTEFQVVQFIPILVVPQIFFSGLIPVDTLPYNLGYLSRIMPLYYGGLGLKQVMVYGYGFSEVLPNILVLCGIIVFLFLLCILSVLRYRRS
jgi:ABC-2 type transport system permease protein